MQKTKIDWCDYTWNPVIGCRRGCPYCYAERINKRFKYIKHWNMPQWREKSFNKKFPKTPCRIFVNSMSDIEYWEIVWINQVLDKIKEYPQHTFLFLTKDFNIYADYEFPENCWVGYTITNQKQYDYLMFSENAYYPDKNKFFLSLEPIQEEIKLHAEPDWIIIGAETGNRKDKIIPELKWINNIIQQNKRVPIFLKGSLKNIWPDKLIQQFPE